MMINSATDSSLLEAPLYATVTWSALHTFQFGFHIAALNGISDVVVCQGVGGGGDDDSHFRANMRSSWPSRCIDMTNYQFGTVTSIFLLGGLLGAIFTGRILDKYGRRVAHRISSCIVLLGCVLLAGSSSFWTALVNRFIIGIGCGVASVTVPLYLGEIGPPHQKDRLGIANQGFIVLGVFSTQASAIPLSRPYMWRSVPLISAVLSLILLVTSCSVKESPIWLKTRGEQHPSSVTASGELESLLGGEEQGPTSGSLSIRELFSTKQATIRNGFIIVVIVMIAQQACGISPVMYYSTKIMSSVFPNHAKILALIIAGFKIPITFTPTLLLKRYSPKTLLVASSTLMMVFSFALAICINMNLPIPSSVAIICYVISYSIGLGPVSWVVISDVMPREAVSAVGSVGIAINWMSNFCMGVAFLPVRDLFKELPFGGVGNIFYLISLFCFFIVLSLNIMYKQTI